MIREDKNKIIKEIMDLRTLIGDIEDKSNEDKISIIQKQLNRVHDLVFKM